MADPLSTYAGLSAERASRKASELVEATAAAGFGWLELADHLDRLRVVYHLASRAPVTEPRHG